MKQRVLLKGKDALDLVHRISSVNLKGAPMNHEQAGLILNPQGKILSYFKIALLSENVASVSFSDDFLKYLEQYTFGEKYEIEAVTSFAEASESEIDRILNLKPEQGKEFLSDGNTNPLEVNLRAAIHDQKGCYPGQEVIEKIISLGSPAKRLCLVRSAEKEMGPLPQILQTPGGQEAGLLTSFRDGVGLAILKRPYAKEATTLQVPSANSDIQTLTVEKVSP